MPDARVPRAAKVCANAVTGDSPKRAETTRKRRVIRFIAVSLAGNFRARTVVITVVQSFVPQASSRLAATTTLDNYI
jgi:hypothetical protein